VRTLKEQLMSEEVAEPTTDDISLRPYVEVIARYRRAIGLSVVGAAVAFGIATLALYLVLPTERHGTVTFRLLFSGADENRYPNGTPFNPTEIVATPVLTEVFAANDLKRYTTLQQLQQALFVLQSNPALQELDYSYQAKLSDTKLTSVDRAKLEDEFLRKRDAIRDPEFNLTLQRKEHLAELPAAVMERVLGATLETWAKQAAAQKGATRPDVDIVSREVFARAASDNESFLVRVDVLRTGAQRIVKALTALQDVPGARAVRTVENRNLSEELAAVEDILKFDIEPLMGLARLAPGEQQDRLVLMAYISNQIVSYRLDLRAAASRAQNLQTSLRDYMAQRGGRIETAGAANGASSQGASPPNPQLMPQLGDRFIDRLMEMSAATQESESAYRRSLTDKFIAATEQAAGAEREIGYYEDLLKQLSTPSPLLSGAVGEELISMRLDRVLDALNQTVDRVRKLYDEISLQTLNPSQRLYTITQPFRLRTLPSLAWRPVLVAFVLILAVSLVVSIAACLLYDSSRRPPHSAAPFVPY
jgi:hypothetical protein